MSESVSFIGLGLMGSTLARASAEAGHAVSVWNRSAARAEPLTAAGAAVASSAADAVAASQLTIVCVTRYEHVREALDGVDLGGRTLVNFCWGTPDDAVEMGAWVRERGGDYLDGGIPVYPSGIGRPETELVYAGPRELWDRQAEVLRVFGGASRHVSTDLGAANAICLAMPGGFYHLAYVAFFEAAAYLVRWGVPVTELRSQVKSALGLLESSVEDGIVAIDGEDYRATEATMSIQLEAVAAAQDGIRRMGQRGTLVTALVEVLERGIEDGHADESCAALFPLLRDGG